MKRNPELDKGKVHSTVEMVNYVQNAVVNTTILNKTTGSITATSLDIGRELKDETSAFDIYVQIIDGVATVTIDGKINMLKFGESIIIPAHAKHRITAKEQFKMITTIIKSGYEL
ncbi:cupin domain-containing protein [Sphingobacterium faecium]|uniref:cupin domain-containing protein n=1 Tax=Sphingobacterium faecium TaxID=34087 RepID=UPI002469AAB1|nr:cupin domain-containing protein [Sphingobacterium faecium]MDH5826949.1 cupin domain-containing protein [Sphingobacterium faecium]